MNFGARGPPVSPFDAFAHQTHARNGFAVMATTNLQYENLLADRRRSFNANETPKTANTRVHTTHKVTPIPGYYGDEGYYGLMKNMDPDNETLHTAQAHRMTAQRRERFINGLGFDPVAENGRDRRRSFNANELPKTPNTRVHTTRKVTATPDYYGDEGYYGLMKNLDPDNEALHTAQAHRMNAQRRELFVNGLGFDPVAENVRDRRRSFNANELPKIPNARVHTTHKVTATPDYYGDEGYDGLMEILDPDNEALHTAQAHRMTAQRRERFDKGLGFAENCRDRKSKAARIEEHVEDNQLEGFYGFINNLGFANSTLLTDPAQIMTARRPLEGFVPGFIPAAKIGCDRKPKAARIEEHYERELPVTLDRAYHDIERLARFNSPTRNRATKAAEMVVPKRTGTVKANHIDTRHASAGHNIAPNAAAYVGVGVGERLMQRRNLVRDAGTYTVVSRTPIIDRAPNPHILNRAVLDPGRDIGMNATIHEYYRNENTATAAHTNDVINNAPKIVPEKIVIKQEPVSPERENPVSNTLYSQLLALGDRGGCITNAEEFDCVICMSTTEVGDGVILRLCLHQFCRECFRNAIIHSDEADIPCLYGDGTSRCEGKILELEIRAMLTNTEYDDYLRRSLRIAGNTIENTIHCKGVNCDGWCICEDGVNQFTCPKCDAPNCVSCQAIHKGLNCKQYQDELKHGKSDDRTAQYLERMIAENEAMKCPKCQIIIMKREGCDWLQCSMCRTEICWVTKQARWGPRGKGDTSGGCRCRIGGRRCHPNCGFCH